MGARRHSLTSIPHDSTSKLYTSEELPGTHVSGKDAIGPLQRSLVQICTIGGNIKGPNTSAQARKIIIAAESSLSQARRSATANPPT